MKVIVKKLMLIMITFCMVFVMNGCGKHFWDYECIWVSDSPYINIPVGYHTATIELNGEKKEVYTGWNNNGTEIRFYDPDIDNGESAKSIIWETECEIKDEKLYITIIKDNVSDMEGETIVLEQQPAKEGSSEVSNTPL